MFEICLKLAELSRKLGEASRSLGGRFTERGKLKAGEFAARLSLKLARLDYKFLGLALKSIKSRRAV